MTIEQVVIKKAAVYMAIDVEDTPDGRRAVVETKGCVAHCPLCFEEVQNRKHECLKFFTKAERMLRGRKGAR